MEKIDRELLIKEISSRLPYGVKAQVLGWAEEKGEVEVPLRVYSINTDGYVYFESNDYDVDYVAVDNCLLFLRPMSSMTEEEKLLFHQNTLTFNEKTGHSELTIKSVDWLNKHHFDYRGLIPMGIALEAPEDMYKN